MLEIWGLGLSDPELPSLGKLQSFTEARAVVTDSSTFQVDQFQDAGT